MERPGWAVTWWYLNFKVMSCWKLPANLPQPFTRLPQPLVRNIQTSMRNHKVPKIGARNFTKETAGNQVAIARLQISIAPFHIFPTRIPRQREVVSKFMWFSGRNNNNKTWFPYDVGVWGNGITYASSLWLSCFIHFKILEDYGSLWNHTDSQMATLMVHSMLHYLK